MLDQLNISDLAIIFIAILISMAIHEAVHAFVAHALGDTTARDEGRLTLNPLKHIDLYTTVLLPLLLIIIGVPPFFVAKPVPFNPARVKFEEFGAALIGVAGPFTNFVLAALAAVFVRLANVDLASGFFDVLNIFIIINLGFFVFNMIPFPPLDGSRLLYALAPEPIQEFMYRIERGGLMSILIFMFLLFPLVIPVVSSVVEALYRFLLV